MTVKKKKIIAWFLLITWLFVIFFFSQQSGKESGNLSNGLLSLIINFLKLNIKQETISFLFRKLAHFTEYMILGFFTINLLKQYTKKERKIIIITIIFGFLYASTDELHQLFVPARSGQFKDVLIDTSGVVFSTIIYYIKKIFTVNG